MKKALGFMVLTLALQSFAYAGGGDTGSNGIIVEVSSFAMDRDDNKGASCEGTRTQQGVLSNDPCVIQNSKEYKFLKNYPQSKFVKAKIAELKQYARITLREAYHTMRDLDDGSSYNMNMYNLLKVDNLRVKLILSMDLHQHDLISSMITPMLILQLIEKDGSPDFMGSLIYKRHQTAGPKIFIDSKNYQVFYDQLLVDAIEEFKTRYHERVWTSFK